MVDFSGWEMPAHFGSQLEEHRHVRQDAGMFDVSHMLNVDVVGEDAQKFLRHLLANDVAKLASPGQALYSCMLNPSGGVLDDLIVYHLGTQRFRVVVNAGPADDDVAWMRRVCSNARFAVEISPRRDLAMIAVQGPRARESLWAARGELKPATASLSRFHAVETPHGMIARTGYTGEDGFEIVLPADDAPELWTALRAADVVPCGLGARDTLRLEAGMNLYGADMDGSTTPAESALDWTVDRTTDRDFVGRAALESASPARALVGVRLDGRGVLRSHMRVRAPSGEGMVTSGTFSPSLGISIAFARIPRSGGDIPSPGTPIEVEVRDRWTAATITKVPFVRHGSSVLGGLTGGA